MPALSNPRHELFVKAVVGGASPAEAYVCAGFSKTGVAGAARRLLRNVAVRARFDELQQEVDSSTLERVTLSREWVLEGLKTVVKRCLEAEPVRDSRGRELGVYSFNAGGANRALELLGKQLGMFADRGQYTWKWDGRLESLNAEQRGQVLEQLAVIGFGNDTEARARVHAEAEAEAMKLLESGEFALTLPESR